MQEQQEFIIKLVSTVLRETSVQKLVGMETVCESLGIGKDKVRELTAAGELKGVKISERLTMWSVRDVNEFIERRKNNDERGESSLAPLAGMREERGESSLAALAGMRDERGEMKDGGAEGTGADARTDGEIRDHKNPIRIDKKESGEDAAGTAEAAEPEAAKEPEVKAEPEPVKEQEPEVVAAEPEAVKEPEVKAEAEVERCTAVHPRTGARCVLPAGHEGKHKLEA